MSINLSPKYGSKPQFTPEFVDVVVRVISNNGGEMGMQSLWEQIGSSVNESTEQQDYGYFVDLIKFGVNFGFWDFLSDDVLAVSTLSNFSEETWCPIRFAEFIHNSVFLKSFEKHGKLNSIAALLIWAHSLKVEYASDRNLGTLIPMSFDDFEKIGNQTGLSPEIVRNSEQWNISKLWLQHSGLFVSSTKYYLPSVFFLSNQIRKCLEKLGKEQLPIRKLINEVRVLCPYLPGGEFGKIWTLYLKKNYPEAFQFVDIDTEYELSRQESLAILSLENVALTLHEVNDAADRLKLVVGDATQGRTVSHFKKISPKEV